MCVGCAFITCALKNHGIEFCWDCEDSEICERWKKHREFGKQHDSFKSYQKLEEDIAFIRQNGVEPFEEMQKTRAKLLIEMLTGFNEGRSKSYYCVTATILEINELEGALAEAKSRSTGLGLAEKSETMHLVLDRIAKERNYYLKLRK